MAVMNIPIKTPDALAELSSRQRRLSQRHRTVLLLVDGRRREDQVRELAVQAGSPASCFDELLDLGMIVLSRMAEPSAADAIEAQGAAPSASKPIPLDVLPAPAAGPDSVGSVLPPSLSLQPDSSLNELSGAEPAFDLSSLIGDGQDEALEEARGILLRAVRAEAPVAGSLTMMRLRRARSREDLESLLEEVESRIFKPFKGLWASQTMARVRELLATQPPLSLPSA
ncbi:MAG TPA: hypothetical protein VE029_13515 [Rhizobacter sp.]|nr:hypothetical protein [Rhizobacter sp.]